MKCPKCNSLGVTLYFREYKYPKDKVYNVGDIDANARVWERTKHKYCKKCERIIN